MKTAKTCIPKLWQQRSNYVNRQPIKTAKTCTPNRYALTLLRHRHISKCSYKRLTIALQCLSQGYYKTQPLLITLWYKVDFLSSGLLLFHEGQAESHQRQESGSGWRKISQQFFSRERNILSLPPLCHLRSDLFKNHIALLSDDNFCKSIKIHIIEHF